MNPQQLASLARKHGSLVRSDLVPDLLSRSAWVRLHASGVLTELQPGVSAIAGTTSTTLLTIEAAALATRGLAVAAGPTSAWLWGAASAAPSDPVHLVSVQRGHSPALRGAIVHRPIDLTDIGRSSRHGLPTTNPLHAILGVAAWAPESTAAVMEELIVGGLMGIKAVRAVIARHAKRGVPGITALRAACEAWTLGDRPPDSLLEIRLGKLLAESHLPAAEFQHVLGPLRLDFAWPRLLAALECDGWENHGRTRVDFDGERERDAWLGARGWVVWRYSWSQIVKRPGWVLSTLRDRVATRSVQLGLAA